MKEFSLRRLKRVYRSVRNKLERVERLEGYSLMEKLQLAFIFSRPVSDRFVQRLKNAKFQIEQDYKKRICRFSTDDGSIVRFSDHHRDVKYFEGVLCLSTPWQINMYNERIAQEREQEEMDEDNPVEQPVKLEVDDYMDFGEDVSQGAFNGRINYEELDEQEFVYPGFPEELKPETSVRLQKRRHCSTTDNGKRVKTSDYTATSSDKKHPPLQEATLSKTTPDEPKISVLALATNIENIALFYNLDTLHQKASLAIEKMTKTGEKKSLSIRKFNVLIDSMLIGLEENGTRKTDDSISMESLLKHLRLFLIRPLGSGIVQEALELVAQKIREFENKEDGVPPNIISESLTHLLMATGF
ncbi:unnamed protein product [Caenorhabditis nigoni]